MTSRSRTLLLALMLCFAARMFFLLLPGTPLSAKAVDSIPDATEYQALAENLARRQTFSRLDSPLGRPEVLRTPGYPLFLAPFHTAFRGPILPIVLAQILLSLLLVLAVRQFGLELTGDERISNLAALLVAVSPNLAFLSTKVVTETVFTLLLVVCFILFNRARSRVADAVGCGASCGLLALIRPIALYLPLLLGLLALADPQEKFRKRLASAGLLVGCAALVLLPWFARNGRLTGRWILSTAGEHNLFLYNAATVVASEERVSLAAARTMMRHQAEERYGPSDTLDEALFWKRMSPVAWKHVMRKPHLAAGVQLAGFVSTLASPISLRPLLVHSGATPDAEPNAAQQSLAMVSRGRIGEGFGSLWRSRISRLGWFGIPVFIVAALFQLALMLFALFGLLAKREARIPDYQCRSPDSAIRSSTFGIRRLLWPVLYFTLLAGALGEARMRAPVEPLLAILAATGAVWLSRRRP